MDIAHEDQLPGQPFPDRLVDPKILDRLLEWARTADDKASKFAILALGLSFFWMYYAILIPVTASARLQSLDSDLLFLDRLSSRLIQVQQQMRNVARVQPRRFSQNNQSIPFFVDVLLDRLIQDRRINLRPQERRDATILRASLANLAVEIERYRAYYESHASDSASSPGAAPWPAGSGDPSESLTGLERAEEVMFQLRDLNTQAANSEWLDAVERTLIADGERLRLATTITASLAPYETLVGTWAAPERVPPIGLYREVARRNGERLPTTLSELQLFRNKLKSARDDAETDLRIRRLRVPLTDIQVDRRIFFAVGPVVVILLYHYLLTYLILARQIEVFIVQIWGRLAGNIASTLRPSDVLFRSVDERSAVPPIVRAVRRPVRWLTHGAVPAVPAALVMSAVIVSWLNAAVGIGIVALALAILCGAYALLLAYGFWKRS